MHVQEVKVCISSMEKRGAIRGRSPTTVAHKRHSGGEAGTPRTHARGGEIRFAAWKSRRVPPS